MSSNYFAFSTAPGAHAQGGPVASTLGHPNGGGGNNTGGRQMDGALAQLGAGSPGSLMPAGSNSGVLPYPGPPPQHNTPNYNRGNPAATPFPSSFHAPPSTGLGLGANGGSVNGAVVGVGGGTSSNSGGAGGLVVPAPRSTAALIAEVMNALPRPPAPSRSAVANTASTLLPPPPPPPPPPSVATSGSVLGPANDMNSRSMTMASPPAPPSGHTTPMSVAAAAAAVSGGGNSPVGTTSPTAADIASSTCATTLVSPSFKAFTTSAATMLTAQGRDGDNGLFGKAAAQGRGDGPYAASATADDAASAARPEATPFSHVELQITIPSRTRDDAVRNEDDVMDLGKPNKEDEEDDDSLDILGFILGNISDSEDESHMNWEEEDECTRYRSDVFDGRNLRQAADLIIKRMRNAGPREDRRRREFRELTLAIVAEPEYRVFILLPQREALTLRYSVVQYLLAGIAKGYRHPRSVEEKVRKFVKLVNVSLVSSLKLAATVDLLLQRDDLVWLGLRFLIHGLIEVSLKFNFRKALTGIPRIAQRLRQLYVSKREYEVDIAVITRLWQCKEPSLFGSIGLETSGYLSSCPVTCMSYFGVRDELITGHMNGSVVLWGGPQVVRDKSHGGFLCLPRPVIRPRGVVPLPLNCVPVAMAGQRIDGQYLAIASMPYKLRRPYREHCKPSTGGQASGAIDVDSASRANNPRKSNANMAEGNAILSATQHNASSGAGVGAIIVITCNENSIRWNKGEVIMRPAGVALTAITAFRNSIVAVGESMVTPAAAASAASAVVTSSPHRLSFVDVMSGAGMRQIPNAHDDYITVLNVLDESSYVLLSGGRDASVKLWDPRSREDSPVVNTALCTAAPTHDTTISAVCATGYKVLSTDLDGSMLIWDLRSMEAPQVRHELSYPIVDVALVSGKQAVAATSRGLISVSTETLEPLDMRYSDSGYAHVLPNSTGGLVFAANTRGLIELVAVTYD